MLGLGGKKCKYRSKFSKSLGDGHSLNSSSEKSIEAFASSGYSNYVLSLLQVISCALEAAVLFSNSRKYELIWCSGQTNRQLRSSFQNLVYFRFRKSLDLDKVFLRTHDQTIDSMNTCSFPLFVVLGKKKIANINIRTIFGRHRRSHPSFGACQFLQKAARILLLLLPPLLPFLFVLL